MRQQSVLFYEYKRHTRPNKISSSQSQNLLAIASVLSFTKRVPKFRDRTLLMQFLAGAVDAGLGLQAPALPLHPLGPPGLHPHGAVPQRVPVDYLRLG